MSQPSLPTDLAGALEDVSQMRNPEREKLWASTNADARKVLSYRENLLNPAVKSQLVASIANYHAVYWLLRHCQSTKINVSSEVARLIVECAWAGSGRLVPFVQPLLLRGRKEGEGVINVKLTKKIKKEPKRKTAFKIYVRPRPMTLSEKAANNYHVISNTSPTSVTLHVGRVHRSGNRLSTEHRRYEFDGVFNEDDGNEVVGETALGSVGGENKGEEGRTVICYGQTGTGKTYTFKAVLDAMKKKLAALEGGEGKAVYITFYEIHGKKCYDLMNGREGIKVLTDSNDKVVPLGAKVAEFKLREEGEGVEECIARFDGLIESALALRSTTSTQRNDVSSRSHSILTITLKDDAKERRLRREEEERLRLEKEKRLEEGGGEEVEEVEPEKRYASLPLDNTHPAYDLIKKSLRLVDLAGSEQNVDTGKMAARDHKESAEINTALMHLKECIRSYGKKTAKSKYRGHLLTRVLKESFEGNGHRSTVIATISPATLDLLHTLNTLNHVANMQEGRGIKKGTDKGVVDKEKGYMDGVVETTTVEVPLCEGGVGFNKLVENWTPADVKRWLAVANGGKFGHVVVPAGVDGKALLGLNETTLGGLFDISQEGSIQARGDGEGTSWVISGAESGGGEEGGRGGGRLDWGRELYQSLRIEQKYIEKKLIKEKGDGKDNSKIAW